MSDLQESAVRTELNDMREVSRIHGEQIGSLSKDIEMTNTNVQRVLSIVERLDSRIDQIERPDLALWIKMFGAVVVVGGGLWALAIKPITESLSGVKGDVSTVMNDVRQFESTQHSANDDNVVMAAERVIRTQSNNHLREVLELKVEHIREINSLRLDGIESSVNAHVGDSDHPGGVRREIEQLRSEVLSSDRDVLVEQLRMEQGLDK